MAGKAVKTSAGHYVWEGGTPSLKDLAGAPSWTVFPGEKSVKGKMYEGPRFGEPGYPTKKKDEEGDGAAWFPAEVSGSDYWTSEADIAARGLGGLGRSGGGSGFEFELQADNYLQDLPYDDTHARLDAIKAGWTLVKAPLTRGGRGGKSEGNAFSVLDEFNENGNRYWWNSVREKFVSGQGSSQDSSLLVFDTDEVQTINRHRRRIGGQPIDLNAGWSPQEISIMAENIRKHGRTSNPESCRRFQSEFSKRNPEMMNEYAYMDDVQGMAVQLATHVRGQRSIRDAYQVIIEHSEDWAPMIEKWSPLFGGNSEATAEQLGHHLAAGIQLALEIDDLFKDMNANVRARMQPNPGHNELKRRLMR